MKTVVIADNGFFMRNALKNILEKNGYKVIGMAEDGQDALNIIKKNSPEIATIDITMERKNGIEVLKEIKSENPNIKVVIVSSIKTDFLMEESFLNGASDFIVKPFSEDKIVSVFSNL